MMRLALPLFLALQSTSVLAADHLEPEHSRFEYPVAFDIFDRDDVRVLSVFKDAFEAGVRARVIAIPSFQPEYAAGISEREGLYRIFSLHAESQLLSNTNIRINRCEAEIARTLGAQIITLWNLMLFETRYSQEPARGNDGVRFHFSIFYPGSSPNSGNEQFLAEQTWSPSPTSRPGRLVVIADAMDSYCKTRNLSVLGTLDRQVNSLLTELQR